MGWLHVTSAGWGVYLNQVDLDSISIERLANDKTAPTVEELKKIFTHERIKFENPDPSHPYGIGLEDLSPTERVSADIEISSYYGRAMDEFRKDGDWKKLAQAELEDYEIKNAKLDLMGKLFAEVNGFPQEIFKGISDYNDDAMLYCTASYPLPESQAEKMGNFTMEKYQELLTKFLQELTGIDDPFEIEWCEEYIKE